MVMASELEPHHRHVNLAVSVAGDGEREAGEDGGKAPRLPRWTRQEILVLIRGKRAAESRGGRTARSSSSEVGAAAVEPKWSAVSSYCKRHGVNRGAVQCRKRWSNLAGDFKKIKEWEERRKKDETESFWVMRNDLRRERKLPGFFDREVFDIMEAVNGGGGGEEGGGVTIAMVEAAAKNEEVEKLFDSRLGPTDEGLFSENENEEEVGRSPVTRPGIGTPLPISEKLFKPVQLCPPVQAGQKQPPSIPEMGSTSQDRKRKRSATDGEEETFSLENHLIEVMERNGKMLADYLEVQNSHSQLDREQRKEHSDSLITVLNKLADAFMRIADKL